MWPICVSFPGSREGRTKQQQQQNKKQPPQTTTITKNPISHFLLPLYNYLLCAYYVLNVVLMQLGALRDTVSASVLRSVG